MKITNFIKDNKYFILGLLILIAVVIVNRFPEGYVFGGGDTNQLISSQESLEKIFFNWRGSGFFYSIFYFLSLIGVSESVQLSFYLGFIIFGAYLSFWIFTKLLFKDSTDLQRSLTALFYALNLYTLFLFTGNWGYSYFPSLYVFIPLLFGLLIKFLKSRNLLYGFWFCLILFFGSSGFGNPAFALSFVIFSVFLIAFLWIIKYIEFNRILAGKLILIAVLAFSVSAFWIFPLIPEVKGGVEGLATSNVINFETIIRSGSSPISYNFSLRHPSDMHFPQNFYYKDLEFSKNFFILLSFSPIFIIGWGLTRANKMEKNKKLLFFSLFGLFLLFAMLVAKVRPPFESINQYIYHIWGFNVLRGYDKTAIYIPFLLSSLLMIIFSFNKKWVYIGVALALLAPLPFYIGKIQQTAGYRVSSKKDFTEAKMSFLTKIPKEYYDIQDILNSDQIKSKIATLPATMGDGSGVTYYPKWEFYGVDITRGLYSKNLLDANAAQYNFPNWNYADGFNEGNLKNNSWIVKLLGIMNAKYIIYHKDAPDDAVGKTLEKMKDLEKRGLIQNLEENDHFILYSIHKDYFLPYISWQDENIEMTGTIHSVNKSFDAIKKAAASADFQEINPKKFIVNIENKTAENNLILAEKFNPLWKAYAIDKNGKETEIKNHFLARGYANGWKIENPENISKIIIEYYPIRLMWRGMIISLITVLCLVIYLLRYYYVKRKMAKN